MLVKHRYRYSAIKNCANNESKTAGGYSWEYGFVKQVLLGRTQKRILCVEIGDFLVL